MWYLDNAATSYPKSRAVLRAAREAEVRFGGNPSRGGHRMTRALDEALFRVRETAAVLFDAAPERVVFTSGATHALNLALFGLCEPGEVLVSPMEHNATRRPLCALRERGVRMVRAPGLSPADFESALTPQTRLLCTAAMTNTTGALLDVAALGALCRRRGLLFVVDAAQGGGLMDLKVDSFGISALCLAGHKALGGLRGCGLLILGKDVCPRPLLWGGSGIRSREEGMPPELPERLEAGTLPVAPLLALGEGLRACEAEGAAARREKERALAEEAFSGLLSLPGYELYGGPPQSGLLLLNRRGRPSEETAALLDEAGIAVRAGLHCAPDAHAFLRTPPTGAVRVSFGAGNRRKDVKKLLRTLKNF